METQLKSRMITVLVIEMVVALKRAVFGPENSLSGPEKSCFVGAMRADARSAHRRPPSAFTQALSLTINNTPSIAAAMTSSVTLRDV